MRKRSPRRRRPPTADPPNDAGAPPPAPPPAGSWLTRHDAARPGFGLVTPARGGPAAAAEEERERPAAGTRAAPAPTVAPGAGAASKAAVPAATEPSPLAPITGTAEPVELEAYANGAAASLQLRGVTRASFRSSFRTEDATTTPATGCTRCPPGQCVHATGTLVADYDVTTRVSLPAVPRTLTECQRERVQTAIDTVLAPHEQEHVAAFETFRGATSRPFDLTLCRNRVDAEVRRLFEAERRARQAAAQAESAALDPFHVDVDLDCDERTSRAEPTPGPGHDTPDDEEEA